VPTGSLPGEKISKKANAMSTYLNNRIHALLFGLSDDLAGELLQPLALFCTDVQSMKTGRDLQTLAAIAESPAQIIFCGANVTVVSQLRDAKPEASIIVVSRHPEVTDWLDSMEAGATDYCAAPFENSQVKWLLESSLRSQTAQA
jgi:DNA-binding NtrC family response regulator